MSEPDHLEEWWRIRSEVPWAEVSEAVRGPIPSRRDGVLDFVRAGVERGAERAARLERALDAARHSTVLDFEELSSWQTVVLGVPAVPFRTGPAFAKGGRERYGLRPDTLSRFRVCLHEAADESVPLPSRIARLYLDICFVHPFPDGNGRSALLCLAHLLQREEIGVDEIRPAVTMVRHADDLDGTLGLVRMIEMLIHSSGRRAARTGSHRHSPPPWLRDAGRGSSPGQERAGIE